MIQNLMAVFLLMISAGNVSQAKTTEASFDETWSVVTQDPPVEFMKAKEAQYLSEYTGENFPTYPVTFERFFQKTSSGFVDLLKKAVDRTLNTHEDAYPYFDKLLHSNGICFQGEWNIDSESPWTGLYATKTKIPVIVRASTTLGGVLRDEKRGFSLALKFFPAPNRQSPTISQNIFLIDTLAGYQMDSIFDSTVSNQPDFGISFDFAMGLHVIKTFAAADFDPSFRPVDHIASVRRNGEIVDEAIGPQGLKLIPTHQTSGQVPKDFRSEMRQEARKKKLIYEIWVSEDRPSASVQRDWKKIGKLSLRDPRITYGCDRRLHFPHPKISE